MAFVLLQMKPMLETRIPALKHDYHREIPKQKNDYTNRRWSISLVKTEILINKSPTVT